MARLIEDIVAEFPGLEIVHQKIPSREVGRHEHQAHEFFLPLQGEISVQANGKTIKAGPGKMLYVPPNLDHSFSSTAQGSGERVIWLIEERNWRRHSKGQFQITSLPSNSLAKELIFYLLIHQKARGTTHFVSALIESLADSLEAAYVDQNMIFSSHIEAKISDARIKNAVQSMNAKLDGLALVEIAKDCGLSLRNFNRLFMHQVGMTPKNYLMRRRVDRAKSLLEKTSMTVTDISLEVGYNSLSKFIDIFKRFEGVLPSDYRHSRQRAG